MVSKNHDIYEWYYFTMIVICGCPFNDPMVFRTDGVAYTSGITIALFDINDNIANVKGHCPKHCSH